MTHLRPALAAVLVAFAVLPSVGGMNLIGHTHTQVCDYVNDTCSALPDLPPDCPDAVCANPCLEEADCVPTCPDEVCQPCGGGCNVPCPVNDCTPECPSEVCQNPCVTSLTGGVDATGGPTNVCGVPVPTCAIDPLALTVCGIPVPLPCGITFDAQPSGNDPTIPDEACGIGLPCPGAIDPAAPCGTPLPQDPCLDDPLRCVTQDAGDLLEECGDLTYVDRLSGGTTSFADLYAKRWIPDPTEAEDGTLLEYEIFASWEMTGATIQVGAEYYPIGFALEWGPGYGKHSVWSDDNHQSNHCYPIGRVMGNEFLASAKGGAAGITGNSSCQWEVSSSYSISEGVELTAGPKPSASTTLTQTVTIGGSMGCTDGTTFDSELLMFTKHQKMTIPPWA